MGTEGVYTALKLSWPFHEETTSIPLFFLSQHSLAHHALTPFRIACSWAVASSSPSSSSLHSWWQPYILYGKYEVCEAYNEHGMPPFIAKSLDLAEWVDQQPMIIQVAGLILFVIWTALFALLETVLALLAPFSATTAAISTAIMVTFFKLTMALSKTYALRIQPRRPQPKIHSVSKY